MKTKPTHRLLAAAALLLSALSLQAFSLSAAAASASAAAPAPAEIRVLTYNILGSRPQTEADAKCEPWAKRKPLVLEILRASPDGAPYDFIGTQEASINPDPALHQVNQLAAAMTGYKSLYAACTGIQDAATPKTISYSNLIFWRADRWQLDPDEHGSFWLSSAPETPGSNAWVKELLGNNNGGPRNVTWGLFHEIAAGKPTGRKVYFFNTHLNVHVLEARNRSALLIMERIAQRKDPSAPVILTGDFNSRRDTLVYNYLTGRPVTHNGTPRVAPVPLRESFATANPSAPVSASPAIDYIFVSPPLLPVKSQTQPTPPGATRPSDHNPVSALLEWQ